MYTLIYIYIYIYVYGVGSVGSVSMPYVWCTIIRPDLEDSTTFVRPKDRCPEPGLSSTTSNAQSRA